MKGQNLKGDLPVTDLPFLFILNGTGLETPPTPVQPLPTISFLKCQKIHEIGSSSLLNALRVSFSVQFWDGCDWHFIKTHQSGCAVGALGLKPFTKNENQKNFNSFAFQ